MPARKHSCAPAPCSGSTHLVEHVAARSSRHAQLRRHARVVPLLALLLVGFGPCGRIPGTDLEGKRPKGAVLDWGFVNREPGTCALEVRPERPHSVTVNCMSANTRLYVGCTDCSGKTWSNAALADPRGRILIGDTLYPVTLTRITAQGEIDAAWSARATKYGQDPTAPQPPDYWLFHLQSR